MLEDFRANVLKIFYRAKRWSSLEIKCWITSNKDRGELQLTLSLPEPIIKKIMETWSVVLTFECVDKILWCDHSNETSSAVLLHGSICFSIFYIMKFGKVTRMELWSNFFAGFERVCRTYDKLITEYSVDDFIFKVIFKMISSKYLAHIQEMASCFVCFLLFSIVTSNIRFLYTVSWNLNLNLTIAEWPVDRNE